MRSSYTNNQSKHGVLGRKTLGLKVTFNKLRGLHSSGARVSGHYVLVCFCFGSSE